MKIVNFGSLNIDYIYDVPHFVRPMETLSSTDYQRQPGGKGLNQSVALARAGARVLHCGSVGADGLFLVDMLKAEEVDTSCIQISSGVSGHAIIQVNEEGENCILLHGGANEQIAPALWEAALEKCHSGDVLLLQAETNGGAEMMYKAHEAGMRIAVNPSPVNDHLQTFPLFLATWLILNEVEGEALSGASDPEAICDKLLQLYPGSQIVLTLGKDGAMYADGSQRFFQKAYPAKAVDTTAAGDTFTGFFLASILAGKEPREAMHVAAKAAAIAVGVKGAAASIPRLCDV